MDSDGSYDDLKWAQKDSQIKEDKIFKENYADGKTKGEEDGLQKGFDDQFLVTFKENLLKIKEQKVAELKPPPRL